MQPPHLGPGPVGAAVVDHDELPTEGGDIERVDQFAVQPVEVTLFEEGGGDDGECGARLRTSRGARQNGKLVA